MFVQKIEWLDFPTLEAEITVTDGTYHLLCFSHPCKYSVGDPIHTPLECFDVEEIKTSDMDFFSVLQEGEGFRSTICGCLNDTSNGIVQVGQLFLHITANRIPKDIHDGQFIQFSTVRIDLY